MRNSTAITFYTIGLYALFGLLAGAVAGPVIGTVLTGTAPGMAGKEQSFVGFLEGLGWGPAAGLVAGVALGWWRSRRVRRG